MNVLLYWKCPETFQQLRTVAVYMEAASSYNKMLPEKQSHREYDVSKQDTFK